MEASSAGRCKVCGFCDGNPCGGNSHEVATLCRAAIFFRVEKSVRLLFVYLVIHLVIYRFVDFLHLFIYLFALARGPDSPP